MKEIQRQTYKVLRTLLQYFRQEEKQSSLEEMNQLWERIQAETVRLQRRRQRRRIFYLSGCAAAVATLLLIIVPGLIGKSTPADSGNRLAEFIQENVTPFDERNLREILLKLSDGTEIPVNAESTVAYTSSQIVLNGTDTVCDRPGPAAGEIDQLCTPTGQQTRLLLPDGTRLWVNACTHVIYPRQFDKNRREIFVDGEVYAEVAHNEQAPFFVRTKDFNVQVLGTKFNVSSYRSDDYSSVVLVEGSVKVENNAHREITLKPDQLVRIQEGNLAKPEKVDAKRYISWTDHLFSYEEEILPQVLKDLEHYYGKIFICQHPAEEVLVSGKLELKDTLSKVLYSLSYSFPITFDEKADTVWVTTTQQ